MSAARPFRLFDPEAEPLHAAPESRSASGGARRGRPSLTGGDIIRRYLADLDARRQAGEVTAKHADNHRRSLVAANPDAEGRRRYVSLAEIIGDIPAEDLIQNDLSVWVAANPQWQSNETKRNNTAAAIACFNWADEEGLLKPCPYRRSKRLRYKRETRRNASDAEADRVWEAASLELRRVLWAVDRLGIRTCEARGLRWEQIRWEMAVIVLLADEHKAGKLQSDPKPRLIGVDPEALEEIRRWFDKRRHETFVFVTPKGKPWTCNNLCQTLKRLRRRLGLPDDLTPYTFRHRFATESRRAGVQSQAVSDQLGHSTLRMTETQYVHLAEEEIVAEKASHFAKMAAETAAARARRKPPAEPTPLFDAAE